MSLFSKNVHKLVYRASQRTKQLPDPKGLAVSKDAEATPLEKTLHWGEEGQSLPSPLNMKGVPLDKVPPCWLAGFYPAKSILFANTLTNSTIKSEINILPHAKQVSYSIKLHCK